MKPGETKKPKPKTFEETARALQCDPDPLVFERAFTQIAPPRTPGQVVKKRKLGVKTRPAK